MQEKNLEKDTVFRIYKEEDVLNRAAEIILNCLEKENISQRQLAECMNEDVRNLNQQMNRRNDMKVSRFIDVLEYLGYRIEIVKNKGIRKVSPEYAEKIIDEKKPKGLFYFRKENGWYTGVDNANRTGFAITEEFWDKEECMKWLRGEPAIDGEGFVHNEYRRV